MSDARSTVASPAATSAALVGRSSRLSVRTVDALLTALFLPVMIMVLFVVLFGGAIATGTSYVTYVVPGVVLLCAGFGAATTAVTVNHDLSEGVVDRLRSMDVSPAALIGSHVVTSVLRNAVSTLLVLAVAYLLGFRPQAGLGGWLAAAGILLAWVLALSWLAAAFGVLASSPDAASGMTFPLAFVPYASSAFVPVDTMPSWLQGFAEHQPVTPVTESLRGLLLGTPVGSTWVVALAWCAGILVVSVAVAVLLFRRRTR